MAQIHCRNKLRVKNKRRRDAASAHLAEQTAKRKDDDFGLICTSALVCKSVNTWSRHCADIHIWQQINSWCECVH